MYTNQWYIYIFHNNYSNYSKDKSINFFFSRIRKYIRLLNDELNLNYKKKVSFKNNKRKEELNILDQILFAKRKMIFNLFFYFFLFYLGFTFSSVLRIRISDFSQALYLLKIKKGKMKKYKNIPIIGKNIFDFIKIMPNETKYVLYDDFIDIKKFQEYYLC